MSALAELQDELGLRLRGGEPWPRLERELIEPSDLSEEDKSALWLYGWTYQGDGPLRYQQRQQALLQ
jgi:hypothetical protein